MWFANVPWADAGAVAFAFVIGGMLGSFLNVIAHRVPAGESVVFGRSRCPHCRAPVRPTDNVPILSWLLLRGRCRDCGGPIAVRYPLVEAACAGLVAAIAATDLAAGGGIDVILAAGDHRPVARMVLHAWLVTTLLAWGLLADAGRPIGMWTWLGAMLIAFGGVAVASLPGMNAGQVLSDHSGLPADLGSATARLLGSGVAWLIGRRFGLPGTERALALAAFGCGWQAVPVLTIVTLLMQRGCRRSGEAVAGVVRAVAVPMAVVAAVACGTAAGRLVVGHGSAGRPATPSDSRRILPVAPLPLATGVMIGVVQRSCPFYLLWTVPESRRECPHPQSFRNAGRQVVRPGPGRRGQRRGGTARGHAAALA